MFSRFSKVELHFLERNSLFEVDECVFNSRVDCINKCYQGFELGVRINEDKKISSMKCFQKYIRW